MPVINVAIQGPFSQGFDYLIDSPAAKQAMAGKRVKIPFRKKTTVGIILDIKEKSDFPENKLLRVIEIMDDTPVFDKQTLELGLWIQRYYHHFIGDTLFTLLPTSLRKGESSQPEKVTVWGLTDLGLENIQQQTKSAQRQQEILSALKPYPKGLIQTKLGLRSQTTPVLKRLIEKAWVWQKEVLQIPWDVEPQTKKQPPYTLTEAQSQAIAAIIKAASSFQCFCLDGVTGSGKTEVYIQTIQHCLSQGKQVLMLVPEITLTQQLIQRFEIRFPDQVVISHSAMTDKQRLASWKAIRDGIKPILIGTRSAVFTPMKAAGLIIIDEEHDTSYKQQDGLRYHARDIAVVRARNEQIPIILGSATPSSETLHNVQQQRYNHLKLPLRIATSPPPPIRLIDMKNQAQQAGLSHALIQRLKKHLQSGNQVLLFLNRRGYAPVLLCSQCQWKATCHHCEAQLVTHKKIHRLCCHHCGFQTRIPSVCPDCGNQDLIHLGHGTERLEETLQSLFPKETIIRIDRDSTRRKGSLERMLNDIHAGKGGILIGTQMLAKGHHFPDVTLAVILNADHGLFSTDFRATERIAQLITQVSGRAGREDKAGEIIIQTYEPEHPTLTCLLEKGYHACLQQSLEERQLAHLPPYASMILLRAEAQYKNLPADFLTAIQKQASQLSTPTSGIIVLGPIPALMEKRAGYYGWQLVFQCQQRRPLQELMYALKPWIEKLPLAHKVRWSIDVDPVEMG